jgi:hypothetical protein
MLLGFSGFVLLHFAQPTLSVLATDSSKVPNHEPCSVLAMARKRYHLASSVA